MSLSGYLISNLPHFGIVLPIAVIPAQAGIQSRLRHYRERRRSQHPWVPAYARTTEGPNLFLIEED